VGRWGTTCLWRCCTILLIRWSRRVFPRVHFDDVRLEIAAPFEEIPVKYVPVALLRERLQRNAEGAARQGMQPLLQFCNRMRKEFGDEPPEMEMTLKVLFLKRIATDLGIERIFLREGPLLLSCLLP